MDADESGSGACLPPAVTAPSQRRLETGSDRCCQRCSADLSSELAGERAKLPTCYGGLSIRVAQLGFAAQGTYWSAAVALHRAAEHL